jgi:hypothetical protein
MQLGSILLATGIVGAQNGLSGARSDDQISLMKVLAEKGKHDIENESSNAYGQFTYISSWKLAFPALYTNLKGSINSLLPTPARSFTGTATLYLGVRLWKGAEGYVVPNSSQSTRSPSSGGWAEPSRTSNCKREVPKLPRFTIPGSS